MHLRRRGAEESFRSGCKIGYQRLEDRVWRLQNGCLPVGGGQKRWAVRSTLQAGEHGTLLRGALWPLADGSEVLEQGPSLTV